MLLAEEKNMNKEPMDFYDLNHAAELLGPIFQLLCEFEPMADSYDVTWQGPYFVERPGRWCASYFMLYRGTLYVSLERAERVYGLEWQVGSKEARIERSFTSAGSIPWVKVLEQILYKLRAAKRNLSAYNNRVARYLPPTCRYGSIKRKYLWDSEDKLPIAEEELGETERYIATHEDEGLNEMTLGTYLNAVAVAYDAVYDNAENLTPAERYRKHADGRDAGLLRLPSDDPAAFMAWWKGSERLGAHPWEIVYGNPHGIMLSVEQDSTTSRWSFYLWAGGSGWYVPLMRMAANLRKASVKFKIVDAEKVFAALRGEDAVEITPRFTLESVGYEEIKENVPQALPHIIWEKLSRLQPVTEKGLMRISKAKQQEEPVQV